MWNALGKIALAILSLFLDKLYVWYMEHLKEEAANKAKAKEEKLKMLKEVEAIEDDIFKAQQEAIDADMDKAEFDRRLEDIHNWHLKK